MAVGPVVVMVLTSPIRFLGRDRLLWLKFLDLHWLGRFVKIMVMLVVPVVVVVLVSSVLLAPFRLL